jgi:hypothetical protein
MWEKIHKFLADKVNHSIIRDIAKTGILAYAFVNFRHVENWLKTLYNDTAGSQKLHEYWEWVVGAAGRAKRGVIRAACLTAIGWAASAYLANAGTIKSGLFALTVGLTIAAIAKASMLVQAVKLNFVGEALLVAKSAASWALNKVNGVLPSFLQFDGDFIKKMAESGEESIGLRDAYRVIYRTIFWTGIVDIAISLAVFVGCWAVDPRALVLLVINVALTVAGYVLGYGTESAFYRKASAFFAVMVLAVAFIIVGYYNYQRTHVAAQAQANQANPAVVEARTAIRTRLDKLEESINPTPEDRAEIAVLYAQDDWYASGMKGPKPIMEATTCYNGKDDDGDRFVDAEDSSCCRQDPSCLTSTIVKKRGADGREVSVKTATLAPDCRESFPNINNGEKLKVPCRYDPRLSEQPKPKAEKKAAVSNNNPPPQPTPAPAPQAAATGSNLGREALQIAKEEGWLQ